MTSGDPVTADATLDATIRRALGLAEDVPLADAAYGRTDGWDSVGHMQLIAAIEEAFGVSVDADEVFAMSDVEAVRHVLRDRYAVALTDR